MIRLISVKRLDVLAFVALGVVLGLLLVVPDAFAQAGNDVGQNLGGLLRRYAGEVYGGIVGIVSLVFLLNRRYTELVMFLLAAVCVAWFVFSPDQIARAARVIGSEIFG